MGKYFKYAIGEIVLVVIGILIALQINNWNEGRKTKLQAQNYRETIVNDLVLDTVSINTLIKNVKFYKKNITDYFSYIDSLKPSSSNLHKLSDSLSNVTFFYMKYFPVNNSFKQMSTNGNGGLLTKKQRDFLQDLLSEQEEIAIITESQLQIATKNKDKSDELSGFPHDIHEKLNATQPKEKEIQSLIHINLWLKSVEELYGYLEARGKKIKEMINDNIDLFIAN
ncbi:DUF6090 family protein [Psychroserpens sp.]|uniref:DUF6090 family protein n=1 Tax=Psychroserpens sp. TaxID=2020870 RepID=UPI003858CF98